MEFMQKVLLSVEGRMGIGFKKIKKGGCGGLT